MLIVTSLSPSHSNFDNQHEAVKSWQSYGEVYSMNTQKEIDQLEMIYNNVFFLLTDKTIEHISHKSLVCINAMIDFAKAVGHDLMIINSDILIHELIELKQDGITIFSRWDYTHTFADANIFPMGFDAFYIPEQFLNIFPPSLFAMGSPWHDFYTPYIAILNDIPVYWPQGKHIYHKIHSTQYNVEEWIYMGEMFRHYFKLPKHLNIGQIATDILAEIKQNAIK